MFLRNICKKNKFNLKKTVYNSANDKVIKLFLCCVFLKHCVHYSNFFITSYFNPNNIDHLVKTTGKRKESEKRK